MSGTIYVVLRRGVTMLAMACASALAACSLLLGEGFTDPNAPADAATTSPDGATNAGAEGGPSTSNDSGKADAPVTDAGIVTPLSCPDAAFALCDDFERTDVLGAWTRTLLKDGGTLGLQQKTSGRVLASSIGPKGSQAQLEKDLTITPSHVRLEVTLEIPKGPDYGAAYIAGLAMLGPSNASIVYLYSETSGVWFVQQLSGTQSYRRDAVPITLATPHRVVFDVTFGGKAQVSVDGTVVIDRATETFLVPKPGIVALGAGSIDDQGMGFGMQADDFVFTAD